MSAATSPVVHVLHASARKRAVAIVVLAGLPVLGALATLAWRFVGSPAALASMFVAMAVLALVAWRRAAALDRRWLVRALDVARPDLDDSSDLLFAEAKGLGALQRLQLDRLHVRLATPPLPDLRARWPLRAFAAVLFLSAATVAATLAWPRHPATGTAGPMFEAPLPRATTGFPTLVAKRLLVQAPAYTAMAPREQEALDARVAERSVLRWQLRFDPAPTTPALVFLDGRRVPLVRDDKHWVAEARIDQSALYRIVVDGQRPLRPDRLYRVEVVRDLPPVIKVAAPTTNLVVRAAGQGQWLLAFEASDDHGIAAAARLRITTAQGSGENITFKEQARAIQGRGGRLRKRFEHRVDLAALGVAEGDDLIVQFSVHDNRTPGPQETRSASYILRWPAPQPEMATGLEGLVRTTLPAYFRSQRQIIIDAEALLTQKRSLASEAFVSRSDAIGVDQRLLRLRYGQFLGEESEGGPRRPLMPTNDAEDIAAGRDAEADAARTAADDDHHEGEPPSPPEPQGFGRAGDVLEEFGHTHDHAEAATLLDPETRTTLRSALDAMWQSELNLRTGKPDAALPHANRALAFIKQVQQASRIYLGRVGSQLPPIDMTRRLGGKRDGLGDRADALVPSQRDAPAAARLWQALDPAGRPADAVLPALDAFDAWLRGEGPRLRDGLALAAASDGVRRDPACRNCRLELRALLWPLLPPPPASPATRTAPDVGGRAYLDALRGEGR